MKPDLSQLKDIHLPDPVSWWPPAPGWWGIFLLLILLVVFVVWLYRRYQTNRWRKYALAECTQIKKSLTNESNQAQISQHISKLLRRVAITRFPRSEVASLSGQDWIDFLNQSVNHKIKLESETAQTLLHAPYSQHSENNIPPLLDFVEHWIKALPAKSYKGDTA